MTETAFLEGERVSLRPVEHTDLAFVRRNVSDPQVWQTMDRTRPMNELQSEEWLSSRSEDDDTLDLLPTVDGSPVGVIAIQEVNRAWGTASLSFWITPAERGNGYGTESVELAVEYAFDQRRQHKLIAHVIEGNDASGRLLEAVGFEREGVHRSEAFIDGEYRDLYTYGLVAEEY